MARKAAPSLYDLRLESDRRRAQDYRDRSRDIGRPSPGQVDRAIVEALHNVWSSQVAKAGDDLDAQRDASTLPVNVWKVADEAVRLLQTYKRADQKVAGLMVMRRLKPRPADKLTVTTRHSNPIRPATA